MENVNEKISEVKQLFVSLKGSQMYNKLSEVLGTNDEDEKFEENIKDKIDELEDLKLI